jgi:hypothetical protein
MRCCLCRGKTRCHTLHTGVNKQAHVGVGCLQACVGTSDISHKTHDAQGFLYTLGAAEVNQAEHWSCETACNKHSLVAGGLVQSNKGSSPAKYWGAP